MCFVAGMLLPNNESVDLTEPVSHMLTVEMWGRRMHCVVDSQLSSLDSCGNPRAGQVSLVCFDVALLVSRSFRVLLSTPRGAEMRVSEPRKGQQLRNR